MNEVSKKIGYQLRRVRTKNKITQVDLATRVGVAHKTIVFWENGTQSPNLEFLSAWCAALGVKMSAPFRQLEDARRTKC